LVSAAGDGAFLAASCSTFSLGSTACSPCPATCLLFGDRFFFDLRLRFGFRLCRGFCFRLWLWRRFHLGTRRRHDERGDRIALRMIEEAENLIEGGFIAEACQQGSREI
jgi:hypothetical protein